MANHGLLPPQHPRRPTGLRQRHEDGRLVPAVAAAVTLVLSLHQVLGSPPVVLGSNGDFDRLLTLIGLRTTGPGLGLPFGWAHYVVGSTPSTGTYVTSYVPLAGLAGLAARTVLGGSIDIRVVGAVLSILLATAVWAVVRAIGRRPAGQWVLGAVLAVGLADSRLVAYLDSWYDEPWSLLVLLALLAVIMGGGGRRPLPAGRLVGVTVLALLLVTAKTQDAVLGLPLGVAVALLGRPGPGPGPRCGRRGLAAVAAGLAVAGAALAYAGAQNPSYGYESEYDLVFADILVHSAHPAATLQQLGLPPSMASLRGSNAYGPGNQFDSPAWRAFEHHGRSRLLRWYLDHPATAARAIGRGTQAGWQARLGYLGYRLYRPGLAPWSGACEPCLYSSATSAVSRAGPAVTGLLWAAALGLAPLIRRRAALGGVADAMVLLVAVSATALVAAVFGEGSYEEVKHLYLFYVANLVLLGLVGAAAVALIRPGMESRRSRGSGPEQPDADPVTGPGLGQDVDAGVVDHSRDRVAAGRRMIAQQDDR